jgi:hypothetical protein
MIAEANAICAQRNTELKATIHPGASLRTILAATSRRAAIERKALSELTRLVPPKVIAAEWRAIVLSTAGALQRTITLERIAARTDRASVARQKTLLNKPQTRLLLSATRAGVKQCSVVVGPIASPLS